MLPCVIKGSHHADITNLGIQRWTITLDCPDEPKLIMRVLKGWRRIQVAGERTTEQEVGVTHRRSLTVREASLQKPSEASRQMQLCRQPLLL